MAASTPNTTIIDTLSTTCENTFEAEPFKQMDNFNLASISNELSLVRDNNDLLNFVNRKFGEILHVKKVVIFTYKPLSNTIQEFATELDSNLDGLPLLPDDILVKEYPLNNDIYNQAINSDKPLLLSINKIIGQRTASQLLETLHEPKINEIIMARLLSRGEVVGFITLLFEEGRPVMPGYLDITEIIAPQIALALNNIQVSNSLKKEDTEKQILFSLSNEIIAVKDESQLLKAVKKHLHMLFNFSDIAISVVGEQAGFQRILLAEATDERREHKDYDNLLLEYYPIEDGVFNVTLATKKPLIFDMQEVMARALIPEYLKFADETGVKEFVAISLHNGEKKLGVFYVSSEKGAFFHQGHLQLIESVASHLSGIVGGIMSNLQIARRQQEQSTLLSISNELASVRNKSDLSALINSKLKQLYEYAEVIINIADEEKNCHSAFLYADSELFLKYPGVKQLAESSFSTTDGIYDVVAAADNVVTFDLEEKHKQNGNVAYINFWIDQGMKELICLPLKVGSRMIGVFSLYTQQKAVVQKRQMAFLQGICSQVAIVIDNVLANDQLMLREQEKSILLSISNDMTSVRTKEDLYELINEKLSEIAVFGELVIGLINEDKITRSAYIFRSATPGLFHDQAGFLMASKEKYLIKDGIMDAVMETGSYLILDIDELLSRDNVPSYIPFWHNYGMREMVGLPLCVGDEDIAVLWVYLKNKGTLNNYHLALLRGVSSQIAIALVNIKANEQIAFQLQEISRYKQQLEEVNLHLVKEIAGTFDFKEIIGAAGAMQDVFQLVQKVAKSNSTVLILGETGTGKELIARAIHNASPRKDKIMIKVNCAALPANLIESELFGHEKGSFTGAGEKRIGKFELANKGTLFLDEIGEMPLEIQAKLLRVLQEREIERVGGNTVIPVDVRIVAATNRNLHHEMAEGRFRDDLFYRLNIFPITLPALRERKDDIPVLTTHFVNRYAKNSGKNKMKISEKVQNDLMDYDWPGNVRELEHLIERSVLLSNGNTLQNVLLPTGNSNLRYSTLKRDQSVKSLEENEREYILMAIKQSNGKISGSGGAAESLRINVSTLNARMRKLKITKDHIFKKE